ncbi:hypothetical protein CERSUDRAFT_153416 [Gelatoporia subvermispora B]|uniref:Sfi1 spindle body domain-containing protein n=1 Tax=Ceriporiopsis subvermispora (strain B) TaxID=914234 RepID=M2RI90_CERS8|nr:hypothetical protein CERSUDRAFT_153416 [Gelatoporia subvermispora B]
MSRFRPDRVSSPAKVSRLAAIARVNELLVDSRGSDVSAQERVELTPDEFEFLDTVMERVDKTATTFLTVFKAYNELMQERGIDSRDEVAYYDKLLKLGTLKGTWGDKWAVVKRQHAHLADNKPSARRMTRITRNPPAAHRVTTRQTTGSSAPRPDTLTLHSHPSDTEALSSDSEAINILGHNRRLHRLPSPTTTVTSNSLGLDIGPPADADPGESISRVLPFRHPVHSHRRPQSKAGSLSRQSSHSPPPQRQVNGIRGILPQARERSNSTVNADDAWQKIKEEQDIRDADRFRTERLLERCWIIWRQGFQWVLETNQQIADARDDLILRRTLQRWRTLIAERHEIDRHVSGLSDARRLKTAFGLWKSKLKEKRQNDWRNAMRARMNLIRERRESKLRKDAWAKWRQSYQSHLSDQHFCRTILFRFLRKWRLRLATLEEMDAAAEHFELLQQDRQLERSWDVWREALDVRKAEKILGERVDLRIITQALDVWKKQLHEQRIADQFYDQIVIRHALGRWKNAKRHIRVLENKASKHIVRQNDVLVRAVMRVWKAHERGRLLDRVRTMRILKQAWGKWKERIEHQKALEDLALSYRIRPSSSLAIEALQRWRRVYITHQNAQAFAVHYHSSQLQFRTLLAWRLQLRMKVRMAKQARIAHKFFTVKKYMQKWAQRSQERSREKNLKVFEGRIVKKFFTGWLDAAQRQRQHKVIEQIISRRVAARMVSEVLVRWTNRVADVKFRELEVTQKHDKRLLAGAFEKWKDLCIRHVEELSLMASYQDVKREENMRRMFYRWLTAARKARHRRLLLEQREEEIKFQQESVAWDKWRERFLDFRLEPLADSFVIQSQRNMMFRAFGIWLSKTKSLPAVRFHSSRLRAKAWSAWRDAMPRALQAKRAREVERNAVLSKALEKWVKAYKTKIELKAVARARYLRLPTVARQVAPNPRPRAPSFSSHMVFPSKPPRPSSPAEDETEDDAEALPVRSRTPSGKFGIASLLTSRSRSPARSERSERITGTRSALPAPSTRPRLSTRALSTRSPSPTRPASSYGGATRVRERAPRAPTVLSTASGGDLVPRGSLWQELRELQLRSRPSLERPRIPKSSS